MHLFECGCRGVCGVLSAGVGCVCAAWSGVLLACFCCSLEACFSPPIRRHAFVMSFRNKLVSSRKKKIHLKRDHIFSDSML